MGKFAKMQYTDMGGVRVKGVKGPISILVHLSCQAVFPVCTADADI